MGCMPVADAGNCCCAPWCMPRAACRCCCCSSHAGCDADASDCICSCCCCCWGVRCRSWACCRRLPPKAPKPAMLLGPPGFAASPGPGPATCGLLLMPSRCCGRGEKCRLVEENEDDARAASVSMRRSRAVAGPPLAACRGSLPLLLLPESPAACAWERLTDAAGLRKAWEAWFMRAATNMDELRTRPMVALMKEFLQGGGNARGGRGPYPVR